MDPKIIPQGQARITVPAFTSVQYFDKDGNLHGHMDKPQPHDTTFLLDWPNDCAPYKAVFTAHEAADTASAQAELPEGFLDV
jgi:hypothetical protein